MDKAAVKLLIVSVGTLLLSVSQMPAKDRRGELEYMQRCAGCHGVDAKGNGPFATQLITSPADLTRLAKRNGGIFPENTVNEKIDGRQEVQAHGQRDMPVWGYRYGLTYDVGRKTRQQLLIEYLRQIQDK